MWNTAHSALVVQGGELLRARLVAKDFGNTSSRSVRAIVDLTVRGMGFLTCVQEHEIRFEEPVGDLRSVATQLDLVHACTSKGIGCALFLEHHAQNPQDRELGLGSQVCSLFVHTVGEMLARGYDIMHHYPLFNRALSLHYADGANSDPPEPKDITAAGGLLDRGAENHAALHGIPLAGPDRVSFSKWNYPNRSEERRETEPGREASEEAEDSSRNREEDVYVPAERQPGEQIPREPASPLCIEGVESERFPAGTLETFNNLPGTLTDRPGASPYMCALRLSNALTFDNLVNYCTKLTREPLGILPSRDKWGSVNPVLLMEDPVDPATGKPRRGYTVTSRGLLSAIVPNGAIARSLCYNEVFLPGRPVSRLNLDVDLKCCRRCNERYATRANRSTKLQVSEALTKSLILVIVESLLRLAKVKRSEFESEPSLRELAKAVGKISVYMRASSVKSKLSLRMLWYLPIELCCFNGIDAYRPLLDEMEKVSLGYVLLSYPDQVESCGLCALGEAMDRGGRSSCGSTYLRISSETGNERRSSVDKAPYSLRKCVRLPNCYKEDAAFEYVDTFNTQDIEDPGFEDPLSPSVGLSSNPVLADVTSLGSRFRDVLKTQVRSAVSGLEDVPDRARVKSEARRLASLWGVPVTIGRTGSGLYFVKANEKSQSFPCPKHDRVHSSAMLSALVFVTRTKHKCFVP